MISRFLYFGYYLKQLNWGTLRKFQKHVKDNFKISIVSQWIAITYNSLKYNISILEYYQFHFFEKDHEEKLKWAGTGFMYEYQKVMNPPKERVILDDKREFYKYYKEYFVHHVFSLDELVKQPDYLELLYKSNKLVFKLSDGKCGVSVNIVPSSSVAKTEIIAYMRKEGFDMVETFIEQHHDLQRLSPSAVNTVRIFTQLNAQSKVEILGCRQRISINSPVDNLAAGNVAASIDETTGIIDGPGVYSDITKDSIDVHPVTKTPIIGFQVPYWAECKHLAVNAALKHPQNRSIGWDIVVTENGPGLIEGNHDWCKLVWQLPVNKGLKHVLLQHLNDYKNLKHV